MARGEAMGTDRLATKIGGVVCWGGVVGVANTGDF